MSGGVGPACDISLPKDAERHEQASPTQAQSSSDGKPTTGSIFNFRQLNCFVILTVLASSGMVSFGDIALVIFSLIYMFFLSKVAFPVLSSADKEPVFNPNSKILKLYILFAGVIGLFLPILYVFEGVLEGDKDGIKAAVPHVFLLAGQVFMEGISVWDRFSLPVRVFVPVFYNSVRIFTLVEWLKEELIKGGEGGGGSYGGSTRREFVGRALAIVNFVLWCYNLLGFLLPVYLPKAFRKYYTSGNGSSKKDS